MRGLGLWGSRKLFRVFGVEGLLGYLRSGVDMSVADLYRVTKPKVQFMPGTEFFYSCCYLWPFFMFVEPTRS